ncbi:PAS domain S-box protein [Methylobacterium terricola]|uniref:histidine kinase n=1 Tax=Methylobacterium terricola TaxID=2583531 RepID=A0A5C4L915_9HYPH|nr:PAS domain-containing protein [Methylobacterium terricola]TNC07654.1 PAS domain S-box protein [Methylobacterium terricola]
MLTASRLRALIAATAELTWFVPPDGQVADIPEWRTYTGQSVEEVAGWGWLDAVHPDDQAATAAAWGRAVETRSRYTIEHRLRGRDGSYRWFNARGAPVLDEAGMLREWAGVHIDVHDRKQAEAEAAARETDFRVMADAIPQLAWMADGMGSIFWFNQRWYDYTGATFEDMRGSGWRSVHHPDHVDAAVTKFGQAMMSGTGWEDTFPLRGADGRYRWFLSRAEPIHDETGKVARWFGTNTDITHQREAETGLREANEEVQRFAYIVSHDLRAPLVNIMGFGEELDTLRCEIIQTLGSHPDTARLNAEYTEALGFIKSAVGKMDALIGAILRLAREGRRRYVPERLAMTNLVQTLADAQRHQAAAKGATVTIEGLPTIKADRLAVQQIFGNLIDNAIKYLDPERPGRIVVSGYQTSAGAWFEITDNGRGIAQADHARVFELFRRSGKQDQPGEGIGLAHVRTLVRTLGGHISLQSEFGVGTRFDLFLPAA